MFRTKFFTSIASLAIVAASPAIAGPGGGHGGNGGGNGGGQGAGAMGGAGPMGGAGSMDGPMSGTTSGLNRTGADIRATARSSSEGPEYANPHAIERANQNSVLSTGTTSGTTTTTSGSQLRASGHSRTATQSGNRFQSSLTGVTTGMTVTDSSGTTIGTVSGVRTVGNGSIKTVQVTLTNGHVVTLAPSSLSLSGGVLTTNSLTTNANGRVNSQGPAHASIQGLTHASPNSVLAGAGVTTLTGLATGQTVTDTSGTSLGTVSNVITNRAGAVVGIQVSLTGGGTVTIPATTLSMDGTTVVTSSTNVGG